MVLIRIDPGPEEVSIDHDSYLPLVYSSLIKIRGFVLFIDGRRRCMSSCGTVRGFILSDQKQGNSFKIGIQI